MVRSPGCFDHDSGKPQEINTRYPRLPPDDQRKRSTRNLQTQPRLEGQIVNLDKDGSQHFEMEQIPK